MMLFRLTQSLMLSMALVGCSGSDVDGQCELLDVQGTKANDSSFNDPSRDALSLFQARGLMFVVVRDSYGDTVTPVSKKIKPYDKVEIQYDDPNDLVSRLTRTAIKKSMGRYKLVPLQEDVRTRSSDGKWGINFENVAHPFIDSSAVAYAREFNTKMLELGVNSGPSKQ